MATQSKTENNSKVALDKADLPVAQEEEETPEPAQPQETEDEDGAEDTPAEDESVAAPIAKKRKLLIMAGAAGLLVLLLGAGLWWFFLRTPPPPPEISPAPEEAPAPVLLPERSVVGANGLALEAFVVPLIPDSQGQGRLLRLNVILECRSTQERDDLLQNEKEILKARDAIYRGLCNRSTGDINNARANGYLANQLKEYINQTLGREVVRYLYFPEFLFAG
jgi:flagellar FliL protein